MIASMPRMMLLVVTSLLTCQVLANRLTPPNEPRDDSFFICYQKRCPITISVSPPVLMIPGSHFTKYKYVGCIISRTPCDAICEKKRKGPPIKYKQFSWASNYPQALNAFYRCAYSGYSGWS